MPRYVDSLLNLLCVGPFSLSNVTDWKNCIFLRPCVFTWASVHVFVGGGVVRAV